MIFIIKQNKYQSGLRHYTLALDTVSSRFAKNCLLYWHLKKFKHQKFHIPGTLLLALLAIEFRRQIFKPKHCLSIKLFSPKSITIPTYIIAMLVKRFENQGSLEKRNNFFNPEAHRLWCPFHSIFRGSDSLCEMNANPTLAEGKHFETDKDFSSNQTWERF